MKTITKIGISLSLVTILLIVAFVYILPKVIKGYDFLNDGACSAPCLGNIIPGVTTETDALKIAFSNRHFGSCNLIDQTTQGGTKYILCQSYKSYIEIGFSENLVSGITIHPFPEVSVKMIIDKFGDPDGISCGFVNLSDSPMRVKMILWFDQYHAQAYMPEKSADTCTLSGNMIIEMVGYNSNGGYDESRSAAERLMNFELWKGFTNYRGKSLP